jgi:hypothetical protein
MLVYLTVLLSNEYDCIFLETVEVKKYDGPDDRIGWAETFVVLAKWHTGKIAPVGFVDQMPR